MAIWLQQGKSNINALVQGPQLVIVPHDVQQVIYGVGGIAKCRLNWPQKSIFSLIHGKCIAVSNGHTLPFTL